MRSARELRGWQQVDDSVRVRDLFEWLAAIAVVTVVIGAFGLVAVRTATDPPTFDDVSQASQAP